MSTNERIVMPDRWTIEEELLERNRLKHYAKRHPREAASCLRNLALVLAALNEGVSPSLLRFGFFRSEGQNVWRIGQTGIPHALETRLYLYVRVVSNKLFPLTIGDKTSQQDDIDRCHDIVNNYEKENPQ